MFSPSPSGVQFISSLFLDLSSLVLDVFRVFRKTSSHDRFHWFVWVVVWVVVQSQIQSQIQTVLYITRTDSVVIIMDIVRKHQSQTKR